VLFTENQRPAAQSTVGVEPTDTPSSRLSLGSTPTTDAPPSQGVDTSSSAASPSPSPSTPHLTFAYTLPATVNTGGGWPANETISGQRYEESVHLYCSDRVGGSKVGWDVAGFRTFTATIGIADGASGAIGAIGHVTITDQDEKALITPLDTKLGSPQTVNIALNGTVQIVISCNGYDSKTNRPRNLFTITLGNAAVASS
jgi:hypothetical protein